jgi:hypothetical protein
MEELTSEDVPVAIQVCAPIGLQQVYAGFQRVDKPGTSGVV